MKLSARNRVVWLGEAAPTTIKKGPPTPKDIAWLFGLSRHGVIKRLIRWRMAMGMYLGLVDAKLVEGQGGGMTTIRKIVADAGLLDPEAGTVGLDRFEPDLWVVHSDEEARMVPSDGIYVRAKHRGYTVGVAMEVFREGEDDSLTKDDVLFLARRQRFVKPFTSGQGTTCGEWTPVVDGKGRKGFHKASAATGWCPVRCSFCYLLNIPFIHQALALNVGEYAHAIQQSTAHRKIPIINLGETGGLVEWCVELNLPELLGAYLDATRQAGVIPYILTKRACPLGAGWDDLNWAGAHVGISLNPTEVMEKHSPGADAANALLTFLSSVRRRGASTVIRLGPIMPQNEFDYFRLFSMMRGFGFGEGRITVDLLRFSRGHPAIPEGFEFRAHKWQQPAKEQEACLEYIRESLPNAQLTVCKADPEVAIKWVRSGLIESMPCACWAGAP